MWSNFNPHDKQNLTCWAKLLRMKNFNPRTMSATTFMYAQMSCEWSTGTCIKGQWVQRMTTNGREWKCNWVGFANDSVGEGSLFLLMYVCYSFPLNFPLLLFIVPALLHYPTWIKTFGMPLAPAWNGKYTIVRARERVNNRNVKEEILASLFLFFLHLCCAMCILQAKSKRTFLMNGVVKFLFWIFSERMKKRWYLLVGGGIAQDIVWCYPSVSE